jgi:hypothetical protein
LVDQTWEDAPDFCDKGHCFQFLGAQGVTTSLTAFLFGGNDIANEAGYSNAIFELTCPNEERLSCGKYSSYDELLKNLLFSQYLKAFEYFSIFRFYPN